jgi:hypothetical protein
MGSWMTWRDRSNFPSVRAIPVGYARASANTSLALVNVRMTSAHRVAMADGRGRLDA